jgi:hypothetical protein
MLAVIFLTEDESVSLEEVSRKMCEIVKKDYCFSSLDNKRKCYESDM